jgi:hypothetical protein
MENKKNKYIETIQNFDELGKMCDDIVNEKIYHERDWTKEEIDLFVQQFNNFQEEDPIIDMEKLDPNFVPLHEFKKKFSGFDDSVIEMLCECENKKLEDARIPPLTIRHENITITDNLSTIKYIDDEENSEPKTTSPTDSKSSNRGLTQEKEKEEEEVSV